MAALATIALLASAVPQSARAQVAAPATPLDAEAAARSSAQQRLTGALSRIAADGSDGVALSEAGRAALALGDGRAALGFLIRAEALMPRDPVIKAALGAAMVQLEDPDQAMRYFDAAVAAGGLDRTYLGDRGLAFDLLGNQARAQADYAVAQQSAPSAELTRRWAISLGISGRTDEAVQMLAPLLRAQDRAAWRSRAMILGMNGRADEARQIARQTLPPELAEALDSYFPLLDRLTPAQLAAASHFGRFPGYETVRNQPSRSAAVQLAAAQTAAPAPPVAARPERTRSRDRSPRSRTRNSAQAPAPAPAPAPVPAPVRVASADIGTPPPPPPVRPAAVAPAPVAVTPAPAPVVTPPAASIPAPQPAPLLPPAPARAPAPAPVVVASAAAVAGPPDTGDSRPGFTALPPAAIPPAAIPPAPVPVAAAPMASAPAPSQPTVVSGWSLADMVQTIEVPEAERAAAAEALSLAEIERIAAEQRATREAAAEAARVRAADQTRQRAEAEARRRTEAQAEARAEQQRLRANPARIWVQVATGSPVSALAGDYRRLTRRFPQPFEGQSGATAEWNRTNRLLVGPFRNAAAARDWLRTLTAAGGQGFVWNSEAGEEVAPLPRR